MVKYILHNTGPLKAKNCSFWLNWEVCSLFLKNNKNQTFHLKIILLLWTLYKYVNKTTNLCHSLFIAHYYFNTPTKCKSRQTISRKQFCKHVRRYLGPPEPSMACFSLNNNTLLVTYITCKRDPWQAVPHHKANPPHETLTLSWKSGNSEDNQGRGTPAESGAPTTQSVMETDLPISAVQLLAACANTLPSINTVTWHTHTPLYKCTLTRWPSHTADLVSAALTFPATYCRVHCLLTAIIFLQTIHIYLLYFFLSVQTYICIFAPFTP